MERGRALGLEATPKTPCALSITPGQHQKHYCSLLERASCSLLAPHTWNTLVPVLSSSEGFQALFERVPGQVAQGNGTRPECQLVSQYVLYAFVA